MDNLYQKSIDRLVWHVMIWYQCPLWSILHLSKDVAVVCSASEPEVCMYVNDMSTFGSFVRIIYCTCESVRPRGIMCKYSRVHISSDEVFSEILKKPSIVQKKMIPHMKAFGLFNKMKQKNFFLKKKKSKWPPKKRF